MIELPEETRTMLFSKRSWTTAFALALIVGGIFYFVLSDEEADTAQADGSIITERVAAAAGAKVTPTQPPLKVEPK
jgi:hypothetical protein